MRKLVIALLCLLSPAMHAADLPAEVTLSVGETVLLMTDLRRAALGKGRVVSLATPEQGQLLLFGESPGETTAQLWLKDGTQHLLRIQVRDKDPARLMEEVRALLNGARITARVSGRHILLEGNRAGTEDRKRAGEVAALFPGEVLDFTDAGAWESMVQFQVRLVEVRRDQLHRLGLRWDQEASGPAASITAGGGSGRLSLHAALATQLQSRIDLLQQQGLAYTFAEPVLSCRSGGAARFVSGGEVPIPVTDGLGSTDVQYKEYGVILEVRPRADGNGVVHAEVDVELSQIDAAVRVGDFPGFIKRRTTTAFNAVKGETIALAGLVTRERGRDRSALPGLGALPGAGWLFRSTRRLERETELVVLITPRVIDPDQSEGMKDVLLERAEALRGQGAP